MKYCPIVIYLLFITGSFGQGAKEPAPLYNIESPRSLIDSLNNQAYKYRFIQLDSAIHFGERALTLSNNSGYKTGACDAKIALGLAHLFKLHQDEALKYGLEALRKSDSIQYESGKLEATLLLGSIYMDLDRKKAEKFAHEALTIALKLNHPKSLARAYNLLGTYYRFHAKDEEAALKNYESGLHQLIKEDDDAIDQIFLLNNIAVYYLKKESNQQKIKNLLEKALQLSEKHTVTTGMYRSNIRLAQLHSLRGEYALAEQKLLLAEKLASKIGTPSAVLEVYNDLRKIEDKLGKKTQAQYFEKRFTALRDSLFNLSKGRKIALMEMTHEMELKEQAIQLLEYEKQIEVFRRNILIVGVMVIIIIATIGYLLIRSRVQKTKELLEVEKLVTKKLKELDALKTSFFNNISHEFRTPLTLILAPIENELKKKNSNEGREALLLMQRNANRLLDLVNQLLDLAKLEAGKMGLRIKQGDLKNFISLLTASFESMGENRKINFITTIDLPAVPYWFDQDKLEKIISNLLSNAFKFTPANGEIHFHASVTDTLDLLISVYNTGDGISINEQERIFSPFYQITNPGGLSQGTGLGLSLVNELLRLYSGTISLNSTMGEGVTFTVQVPTQPQAFHENQIIENTYTQSEDNFNFHLNDSITTDEDEEGSNSDFQPEHDSVLIAEDNADLRAYITATLQQHQFEVISAHDGQQALALAFKHVPSLILSDLMMPHLTGTELTKKLKQDERTSHIPIILLTAKADLKDRLQGLKIGADDYISKPFNAEELMVRINNLILQRKKLARKYREHLQTSSPKQEALSLDDKFLLKAHTLLEQHLSNYTFSVEILADEMNMSKTQLQRKLKYLTGLAPNDFIKTFRLKRAAEMIEKNTDLITQIGYSVGFSDQSYFTKCFKKQFGVPPSLYKETLTTPNYPS